MNNGGLLRTIQNARLHCFKKNVINAGEIVDDVVPNVERGEFTTRGQTHELNYFVCHSLKNVILLSEIIHHVYECRQRSNHHSRIDR